MASKQKQRPPMSIAPKVLAMSGGLAARSQSSPYEDVKNDPEAAKALENWQRKPAERVADSIGAVATPAAEKAAEEAPEASQSQTEAVAPVAPIEAPVAAPVAVAAPAPVPAVEQEQDAAADMTEDLDDELSEEEKRIYAKARFRKYTKRWNEEYAKLFAENGKTTPNHFRVDTELYAKISVFRDESNETWGELINEALKLLIKKRERDIGHKA